MPAYCPQIWRKSSVSLHKDEKRLEAKTGLYSLIHQHLLLSNLPVCLSQHEPWKLV